jgi:hypothetical protein
MTDPLPSDVVARLKSDPTAALAAALILAGSFPDLVSWAVRVFGGHGPFARTGISRRPLDERPKDGAANHAVRSNGVEGARAKGRHSPREAAAEHDQGLLALLRANPAANVTEIIRMNGRPRNSTVASLERLEKAGLVEHASRGKWTVVDPDLLDAQAPRPAGWVEPLSGARVARHAADGRVRDETTLA